MGKFEKHEVGQACPTSHYLFTPGFAEMGFRALTPREGVWYTARRMLGIGIETNRTLHGVRAAGTTERARRRALTRPPSVKIPPPSQPVRLCRAATRRLRARFRGGSRFRGVADATRSDPLAALSLPREKRIGVYLSFQNGTPLFLRRAAVPCHVGRGSKEDMDETSYPEIYKYERREKNHLVYKRQDVVLRRDEAEHSLNLGNH